MAGRDVRAVAESRPGGATYANAAAMGVAAQPTKTERDAARILGGARLGCCWPPSGSRRRGHLVNFLAFSSNQLDGEWGSDA